jgi:hypothetical protein
MDSRNGPNGRGGHWHSDGRWRRFGIVKVEEGQEDLHVPGNTGNGIFVLFVDCILRRANVSDLSLEQRDLTTQRVVLQL